MEKDATAVWNEIMAATKDFLPSDVNDIWLKTCMPTALENGILKIDVPNVFAMENIDKKIRPSLERYVREKGLLDGIELINEEDEQEHERARAVVHTAMTPTANGLNPNYVFETFVVGKSNRFAHAAGLAVSESPGEAYNPLFIWGGVGLGKTHLMHAIAHQIEKNLKNAKTLYVSSEKFTNDMILSIKNNKSSDFRAQYRNLDILLVDDIQFISDKESTQEEFFHTFNSLHEAKKQVVISSDRPPKEIRGVTERLVSRFEWGLVADIQPPDLETRVAILQKKSEIKNYDIPYDVILFLAQNIPSNIRELEGALNRVVAYSEITSEPMSADNIVLWLKDVMKQQHTGEISIYYIQQLTAETFGFSVEDLVSSKRTSELALARQIGMYVARMTLRESLQQIGIAFNKKDHTTVLHACNKIETLVKTNERVKNLVDNITKKCG